MFYLQRVSLENGVRFGLMPFSVMREHAPPFAASVLR